MRRVVIRPATPGLGEISGIDWGGAMTNRDATEWRREITDAGAVTTVWIGGGITDLPNATHALGIVSYRWRSSMLAINGVFAGAKLKAP